MFCNACGSQNDADCRFCMNCGNKLDAEPSVNPVTAPAINSVPVGKVCPRCNERCDTDELFCPRCGFTFQLRSGNEKTVASERESANTFAKICRVCSIIVMCLGFLNCIAYTVLFPFLKTIPDFYVYFADESISDANCIAAMAAVSTLIIAVGLIIGKSNIVPGIGYAVFALTGLMPVIFEGSEFFIFSVLFFVMNGLLSALFFVKDEFLKKLWFVPCILMLFCYASLALPLMEIIIPMKEATVDPEYFIASNFETIFVLAIAMMIISIAFWTALPVGYAAKSLWGSEKKSQNAAVRNYIDNIY